MATSVCEIVVSKREKSVTMATLIIEAGDRGFEPRHTDPESAVLPLDESPAIVENFTMIDNTRQFTAPTGSNLRVQYGLFGHQENH